MHINEMTANGGDWIDYGGLWVRFLPADTVQRFLSYTGALASIIDTGTGFILSDPLSGRRSAHASLAAAMEAGDRIADTILKNQSSLLMGDLGIDESLWDMHVNEDRLYWFVSRQDAGRRIERHDASRWSLRVDGAVVEIAARPQDLAGCVPEVVAERIAA